MSPGCYVFPRRYLRVSRCHVLDCVSRCFIGARWQGWGTLTLPRQENHNKPLFLTQVAYQPLRPLLCLSMQLSQCRCSSIHHRQTLRTYVQPSSLGCLPFRLPLTILERDVVHALTLASASFPRVLPTAHQATTARLRMPSLKEWIPRHGIRNAGPPLTPMTRKRHRDQAWGRPPSLSCHRPRDRKDRLLASPYQGRQEHHHRHGRRLPASKWPGSRCATMVSSLGRCVPSKRVCRRGWRLSWIS